MLSTQTVDLETHNICGPQRLQILDLLFLRLILGVGTNSDQITSSTAVHKKSQKTLILHGSPKRLRYQTYSVISGFLVFSTFVHFWSNFLVFLLQSLFAWSCSSQCSSLNFFCGGEDLIILQLPFLQFISCSSVFLCSNLMVGGGGA
jgi:hypothetical protein